MQRRTKLLAGAALLFAGSVGGTYWALQERGMSPDVAARELGNQEQQKADAERALKVKIYKQLRAETEGRLHEYLERNLNVNDRFEAEAGNYLLTLLHMDKPMDYKKLNVRDPVTRFFSCSAAIARYNSEQMGKLSAFGSRIGETDIPSPEQLDAELKKRREEFNAHFGLLPDHFLVEIIRRSVKLGYSYMPNNTWTTECLRYNYRFGTNNGSLYAINSDVYHDFLIGAIVQIADETVPSRRRGMPEYKWTADARVVMSDSEEFKRMGKFFERLSY